MLLKKLIEMAANGESSRRDESVSAGGSSPRNRVSVAVTLYLPGQNRPNGATELSAAATASKRDSDGNQIQQSGRAAQPSKLLFASIRTVEERQQHLTAVGVELRKVEAACGSGQQHTDLHFPADDRSLFGPGDRPHRVDLPQLQSWNFSWKRPEELASQTGQEKFDWVLFRGRPQASDIKQGLVGY